MKSLLIIVMAITLAATGRAEERPTLKDSKDKVSYSIGLDIGATLKKQNIDVNTDALFAGFRDAFSGAKPLLTDEQIKETMTAFSQELTQKQQAAMKDAAQKNAAAGEKFLAENKSKQGVKVKPVKIKVGDKEEVVELQYKVIKEGSGPSPKASDTVVTNYRGTLINGTEFDSSYKRNEPATFPVSGVIKGWSEALQLMKKGSKYQLFVPATLAYGMRGAGQDIGPNETLIFEVELVDIKPAPAASVTPATTPAAAMSPTAPPKKDNP